MKYNIKYKGLNEDNLSKEFYPKLMEVLKFYEVYAAESVKVRPFLKRDNYTVRLKWNDCNDDTREVRVHFYPEMVLENYITKGDDRYADYQGFSEEELKFFDGMGFQLESAFAINVLNKK
jgi:hypothetical protein